MPSTVAVIVPVIGRPRNAAPFMESLRATEPDRATVYAMCEHDDPASQSAWKEAGAVVVADHEGRTYAEKLNIGLDRTEEPWLLTVGDDVKFHPGWLDGALAKAPAKVIGTNDLQMGHIARSPHTFIERDYIMTVGAGWNGPGTISYPYIHWYVDDEIATSAQQREVWAYAPESVIEHLHVTNQKAEDDEIYQRGRTQGAAQYPLFLDRAAKAYGYIPLLQLGGGQTPHQQATVVLDSRFPKNAPARNLAETPWRTDNGKIVDCTVRAIYAHHIMQKIPRGEALLAVMNEAWRVLEPGGTITMFLPVVGYTDSKGTSFPVNRWEPYADPMHVSYWWLPEAFSMYFAGDDHRTELYGASRWSPLGPLVKPETVQDAMASMGTFWTVRDGWEGVVRLEKPKSAPLTRSWK